MLKDCLWKMQDFVALLLHKVQDSIELFCAKYRILSSYYCTIDSVAFLLLKIQDSVLFLLHKIQDSVALMLCLFRCVAQSTTSLYNSVGLNRIESILSVVIPLDSRDQQNTSLLNSMLQLQLHL